MRLSSASCAAATIAGLLTASRPAWIEHVFGVDPDARSGAVEWLVTLALFGISIACAVLALHERRVAAEGPAGETR